MYLIDTDILIYSLRGHPHVTQKFKEVAPYPKALSVITYGELLYGAYRSGHREENLARIRRLGDLFPIIEVGRTVAETFSDLKSSLALRGKPIDDFDLLIASTALVLGYSLVTNNTKHFQRIPGLHLENWSS